MNYVQHYEINGISTKQIACIVLHGEPTAATEGAVGVLGIDVDSPTHDLYKCVGANNGIYEWELHSGGSGGSGGDTNIIFADSVDELPDPSTVPEGSIAIVPSEGVTLTSPNGTVYCLTVSDDGTLAAEVV